MSLREQLAALAHEQWAGWMDYLFSKCTINADGTATIPAWAVERWQRQMQTSYDDLPEQEQESDRAEADRVYALLALSVNEGETTVIRRVWKGDGPEPRKQAKSES